MQRVLGGPGRLLEAPRRAPGALSAARTRQQRKAGKNSRTPLAQGNVRQFRRHEKSGFLIELTELVDYYHLNGHLVTLQTDWDNHLAFIYICINWGGSSAKGVVDTSQRNVTWPGKTASAVSAIDVDCRTGAP